MHPDTSFLKARGASAPSHDSSRLSAPAGCWAAKPFLVVWGVFTPLALAWITLAGTILSLAGVIFAGAQILKTKRAALAAEEAAQNTQRSITNNVALVDLSTSTRSVEEVKSLIRAQRYEPALLRLSDLNSLVIQVQHIAAESDPPEWSVREMLTNLSVLRDLLEQKLADDSVIVETAKVNAELSRIGDHLGHWVSGRKFTM